MRKKLDLAVNLALLGIALLVGATVVRNEIRGSSAKATRAEAATERLSDSSWQHVLAASRLHGSDTAPAQLVAFIDVECPFCRRAHLTVDSIVTESRGAVALRVVHFPLSQHRFAAPGALALECARTEDRLYEMLSVIFERQDSLGLLPWEEYAKRSGMTSVSAFRDCMRNQSGLSAGVDSGLAVGREIGVRGTPAFVLNGIHFVRPPTARELRTAVRRVLENKGMPSDA